MHTSQHRERFLAPAGVPVGQEVHAPCLDSRLQPAAENDIESIVQLISRAMNPDEGNQARETLLFHFSCKRQGINDGRSYYVLNEQSAPRGIAGLHHYCWGPPENVWLAWFAVDPLCHRRGFGTLLLQAVTQEARRLGYRKFFIETYSTPEFGQARAFYQAQGFEPAGQIRSYLANGGDMIVFSKELSSYV